MHGSCSRGDVPSRWTRHGRRRRAGARHRCHLRGRASVRRDPRHPRSRRRARVAPQPRHEYAAEDLPVPPVRPRHRRDAPVDAYAGARRQRRHPHRRLAAGVRGRHPRGAGRPADGRHDWRARGGARGHQVQLRRVSGTDTRGRGAPHERRRAPRWLEASRDARHRAPRVCAARSLQLHGLRRPGDGGSLRAGALRGADRRAAGGIAGAGARRVRRSTRRPNRARRRARAPGVPPWRSLREAER